jgi:ribosomal protein S18 acetylase RimI-like enzyme
MSDSILDEIEVRPLRSEDFDNLVHLDSILLKSEKRRAYWEKKFAVFRLRHPNLSLVAMHQDKLIGYIMGNISGWEFGIPAGTGWVEIMGVDPGYQRKGMARRMMDELMIQFQTLGIKTVYTMIRAKDENIKKGKHQEGVSIRGFQGRQYGAVGKRTVGAAPNSKFKM